MAKAKASTDDAAVLPSLGDAVIYHGERRNKRADVAPSDYAAIVTRVHSASVNLRVMLDGTEDLFVEQAEAGDGAGQYSTK